MYFNFDKVFDEFYSKLNYEPISPSAISLFMAILQIAKRRKKLDNLKIANSTLTNLSGLNISSMQRARNILIQKEFINYKKGINQNDFASYSIICSGEQADEQASEQANEQANEQAGDKANAHNKLNYTKLLYYLININKEEGEKNFSDKNRFIEYSQAKGIIRILKQLNIYVEDIELLNKMNNLKQKLIIQYAVIEELYFSPYRVYLKYLTYEIFNVKFEKTCIYVSSDAEIEEKISYLIITLQNYFNEKFESNEKRCQKDD